LNVGGSKADEAVDIEAVTGQEIARRPFSVPGGGCSAVSPDGRLIAKMLSSSVVLWNLETNQEHAEPLVPVSGAAISSCGFFPDGLGLGVGLSDGSFELWDVPTLKLRAKLPGHAEGKRSIALEFSPDGKSLASRGIASHRGSIIGEVIRLIGQATGRRSDQTSEVLVIDVATGQRLGLLAPAIHPFFSPDGQMLAVRDSSLAIQLFDVPAAASGNSR
jgi:WD40 repeat protein